MNNRRERMPPRPAITRNKPSWGNRLNGVYHSTFNAYILRASMIYGFRLPTIFLIITLSTNPDDGSTECSS
uniref:Inner membrane protein n=1 Tax=Steinernema glaseri TaxID=37863 RepID=A0A1I7Y8W9_9BILA